MSWSHRSLEELVVLSDSGTWGDEGNEDDGAPVLRSTNIQDSKLVLNELAWRSIPKSHKLKKRLDDGDIIVTTSSGSPGHIGKCCLFQQPNDGREYYFSNFTLRLRANPAHLKPHWLYYWLSSPQGRNVLAAMNNTTTGLRNLDRGKYLAQKLPLPPLVEQQRMVAILDKADEVRRKRREAIRLTEELLRSHFLEMFGDPVTNPKGWNSKRLVQACKKVTDGTHDTPARVSEGIPYITGKHIKPFRIDFENCDYLSLQDHVEVYKRCNPEFGDVLYTNIGVNLGTAAMCNANFEFSMKNVALLKLNRDILSSRYLEHLLNSETMKQEIVRIASLGGAQKFLSLNNIKDLVIPVPPIELQKKFEEVSVKVFRKLEHHDSCLLSLENLFNSLLQRAFRGEL